MSQDSLAPHTSRVPRLASLAWCVAIVRARAESIGSGKCPSWGYDASTIDGACPECGKHRDEVKDGLL